MLADIADAIAAEATEIFRAARRGAGRRGRGEAPAAGRVMARLFKQAEAKTLALPGRISLRDRLRRRSDRRMYRSGSCEIEPAADRRRQPRGPHVHHGFEECIHVL